MTRLTSAQALTGSTKRLENSSDFLTSFAKTPIGDQLARVVNEKAINQSLKNLIFTNIGERLFQPYIGSNINAMLFENNTSDSLDSLEFFIETTIKNCETRINLLGVEVKSGLTENEIKVMIVYNTINSVEPITFEYILKRVR